jgi:hypothetical protein
MSSQTFFDINEHRTTTGSLSGSTVVEQVSNEDMNLPAEASSHPDPAEWNRIKRYTVLSLFLTTSALIVHLQIANIRMSNSSRPSLDLDTTLATFQGRALRGTLAQILRSILEDCFL